MTRVLLLVTGALVLCISGLVYVVVANREAEQLAVDNLLAEKIALEVARAEDEIDFGAVTDFPWDVLLVVQSGTDGAVISEQLAEDWRGAENFATGDLMIFVRAGRVARYADYRGEGRFEDVDRPIDRFEREDAVFEVDNLVMTPR